MSEQSKQAVEDPGFWSEMGKAFKNAPENAYDTVTDKYDSLRSIGSRADAIARDKFPDSARDASRQNAFRHALGTGMLTQELGGGALGSMAAKGAGYIWEGLGAEDFRNSGSYRNDTRHDLNANAIGAKEARRTADQEALVNRLKLRANQAKLETPPSVSEASPGYMTRSVR